MDEGRMNHKIFSKDNPFGTQAKVLHHTGKLCEIATTGDTSGPVFMEVNLTNACNMACQWCISSNFDRDGTRLRLDPFRLFCGQYVSMGGKALTFSGGGEPTCHPQFIGFVAAARSFGIELGLFTNGTFHEEYAAMVAASFRWVRVSLDTVDREEYRKWKGVDKLEKVLKNIDALYSATRNTDCRVGVNVNVGADHTPEGVARLVYATHRISDYIQFRPILPRPHKNETDSPENKETWAKIRELKTEKIYVSDDKLVDIAEGNFFTAPCMGHVLNPVLDADGSVRVCMYHPRKQNLEFGNIYDKSFYDIWHSEQRKKVVAMLRDGADLKALGCQPCCKLVEINKLLDYQLHPERVRDVNFL
jgi:MoaA/NifB/PqqE/SkfB family radical SAM enzyme